MPTQDPTRAQGTVVAHVHRARLHDSDHERSTLGVFVRQLAGLLGYRDGGFHDPRAAYPGPLYFVPTDTLTQAEAAQLGIRGPSDLFGGVVPHAFVATKVISHPLVDPSAPAVAGWNPELAARLGDAVLAGFAAFTAADARLAGLRLLASGPVRLKPVQASGGRGQSVARTVAELERLLAPIDDEQLEQHGLVLEEDMQESATLSVGQVQVGSLVASYFGVQKLTRDNRGRLVFGGSDLTVARGSYEQLLALQPGADIVQAIQRARQYEAAVQACYPGFYASRSNYDVLVGRDAAGRWRCAVLEQSWRAGGATGPELAALEALQADPSRQWVRAGCVEVFGDTPEPPPDATIHFRGVDSRVGPMTKYTVRQ